MSQLRITPAAPIDRDEPAANPVEAFLSDEQRVEEIRAEAREDARRRAEE